MVPALPAIGIVTFFFLPPAVGVILTGVGALFGYNLFKLSRSTLQSRIVTSESSVTFDFGKGHADEFIWEQITHAGTFREPKGKRMVFVYEEPSDRLVTIPDEYESYDQLVEEIRIGTSSVFETVDLATQASLNDYLRNQMEPDEPDEPADEEISEGETTTDDSVDDDEADSGGSDQKEDIEIDGDD